MKKALGVFFLVVFAAGASFGTAFLYDRVFRPEPTTVEKQREAAQILESGVLRDAMDRLLRDNTQDPSIFESGWFREEFPATVLPRVRVVQAEVTGVFTREKAAEELRK